MKNIVNLLFEAKILKEIPRSGYHFLGSGKESVAEHAFLTTFIAYVMAKMVPEADALKLISMCLIHDLPESRTSDLNYVHKLYTKAHENRALADITEKVPFGIEITKLFEEFNEKESLEARLAKDADQISLILELKALKDTGYRGPEKWLPGVCERLGTEIGKKIAADILEAEWDDWWYQKLIGEKDES